MPTLKIDADDAVDQPWGWDGFEPRPHIADETPAPKRVSSFLQAAVLFALSFFAMAINGYHPYGEDAGIYVAGIKLAAHPGLYGSSAAFITPYFRLSLFTVFNAWMLRVLHLPLEQLLFALQILTTWLLLYACWGLAERCFQTLEERWGALLLITVCLSIPVAGSALYLMDPYLTGRSFSTPLTLLAICACLDGRMLKASFLLLVMALFHPLMAIYGAGFVFVLWAVIRSSWTAVGILSATAFASAIIIQYSQRMVFESTEYRSAVASRSYYFLSRWQWYELFGLFAPLLLMALYGWSHQIRKSAQALNLAKACLVIGPLAILIALSFARPTNRSHLLAALQTIRPFLWIYFCMFLFLGGVLGRYCLHRSLWRWTILFIGIASGLGYNRHLAYPASPQVEAPWVANGNGWHRAFLWIRQSTTPDSVVALDADYINAPGEDAQGFRAIAERGSLADWSKDGGAAAAFPELAARWWIEQTATTGLNRIDDAERLRRLAPFHVDWIVLNASAPTHLDCPFVDNAVRVCRLH